MLSWKQKRIAAMRAACNWTVGVTECALRLIFQGWCVDLALAELRKEQREAELGPPGVWLAGQYKHILEDPDRRAGLERRFSDPDERQETLEFLESFCCQVLAGRGLSPSRPLAGSGSPLNRSAATGGQHWGAPCWLGARRSVAA